MSALKRQALDAIIASLDRDPQNWCWRQPDSPAALVNRHADITLWWYCGSAYLYEPNKVRFGFWGTRRLKRALRRWRLVLGRQQEISAQHEACIFVINVLARDGAA